MNLSIVKDKTETFFTGFATVLQTELNCREGAWERLSRERDPLVLSSLMWSWLEQLKEPIISSEDIKALSEKKVNAHSSLDSLEKVTVLISVDHNSACFAFKIPKIKKIKQKDLLNWILLC